MMKSCLLWLNVVADLFRFLVLSLRSESSLAAENLFLRKQLGFYQERKIRPCRTSLAAQVTLVLLSCWFNWRRALTVVTPRTFIGWQRKRSQLFWRSKCRAGRPRIPPDLQRLIRTMASENPSWGQERIANELLVKLGLRVSPRTIRKYLPESPGAPGSNCRRDQRWLTFLKNHAAAFGVEAARGDSQSDREGRAPTKSVVGRDCNALAKHTEFFADAPRIRE
jgi:putative transposase